MLKDKFKKTGTKTAQDKKIEDENGFWLIKDNPITKIGVFPYLGRQISPDLEPDKIYQVLRPEEELTNPETLKSLELIPIVNDHTMIGKDFTPAEQKGLHGTTGQNPKVKGNLITNDLKLFSEEIKNEIENDKKDLSAGYRCDYEITSGEYKGQHYDAIQRNIRYNHIALVDEGRMGSDVRVMDSSITFDSLRDILQIKEKTMENENQAQDVDKREILREADAIAMKPASEFEGGEEEKFRTLTKKLEQIAYNPSESGANDEDDTEGVEVEIKQEGEDEDPKKPCGDDDIDKRKKIEEVGRFLREKGLSNEDIQFVLKEMFEDSYNNSETGASDEDPEAKKDDEEKPVSMDEAVKYLARKNSLISRLKPIIGDNAKYDSMTIKEVTKYACDKLDIKNSLDTLEGYIKAHSKASSARVTIGSHSVDSALETPAQSPFIANYLAESK